MSKLRIGILGGTFDPIHNGHILVAESVLELLELDKILFVPTFQPWQKANYTDVQHRVAMIQLAIADNPNFELSLVDVERGGPTYSIDTVSDLQKQHPDSQLVFILGSDAANSLPTWRNIDELMRKLQFIVIDRPGSKFAGFEQLQQVSIDALDLSATDVRKMIAEGKSVVDLVPAAVAAYIQENGLYGA